MKFFLLKNIVKLISRIFREYCNIYLIFFQVMFRKLGAIRHETESLQRHQIVDLSVGEQRQYFQFGKCYQNISFSMLNRHALFLNFNIIFPGLVKFRSRSFNLFVVADDLHSNYLICTLVLKVDFQHVHNFTNLAITTSISAENCAKLTTAVD